MKRLQLTGSKRKSKGMATEQEVHDAGGQKCLQQNLNIAFLFWLLNNNSPSNQPTIKTILEFIKGNATELLSENELMVKLLAINVKCRFTNHFETSW